MRCSRCNKEITGTEVKERNKITCVTCYENNREPETCYYCGKGKNPKELIKRGGHSVCVKCLVAAAMVPLYGHSFAYWDKLTLGREKEASKIWEELKRKIPIKEYTRLYKWAVVFHCIDLLPIERCILRAILSRNLVADEVVKEIIQKQSVDDILPMGF